MDNEGEEEEEVNFGSSGTRSWRPGTSSSLASFRFNLNLMKQMNKRSMTGTSSMGEKRGVKRSAEEESSGRKRNKISRLEDVILVRK